MTNKKRRPNIKKIQSRLLYMGKEIAKILDAHKIPYTMFYGTVLGAYRHEGFVPWDDDFDLAVFDDVYDEAMVYLRAELPEDLFLEDEKSEPKYFHAWAHVKDLKTITECDYYMQDNFYEHHGLSVDLYRISRVRVRDLCENSELEFIKYIRRRKELGVLDKEEYERRIEFLGALENRFWLYASETETLETIDREIITNYYTSRLKIELAEFFPLKKYKFEDTYFWGPRDAEAVLKKFYGVNYMKLPPVKDRKRHYSSVTYLK